LEVVDAMKETPILQKLFGEKRQKSVEPFCSLHYKDGRETEEECVSR